MSQILINYSLIISYRTFRKTKSNRGLLLIIMEMRNPFRGNYNSNPPDHNSRPSSSSSHSLNIDRNFNFHSGKLSPRGNPIRGRLANDYQVRNLGANEGLGSNERLSPYKKYQKESLEDRNFLLKSRISHYMGSDGSQAGQSEKELFSPKLLFLLSKEQQNLQSFKLKIDNEKEKVNRDFEHFHRQIEHIINDLRLSMSAELDMAYRDFMKQYSELKSQVSQFKKLREGISINLVHGGGQYYEGINQKSRQFVSNYDMLQEIQRDAEMLRNQKVYAQIGELQRQKIDPIMTLAERIIITGDHQKTYYQQHETNQFLSSVKSFTQAQIKREGFQGISGLIFSCDKIVQLEFEERQENNIVLKGPDFDSQEKSLSQRRDFTSLRNQREKTGANRKLYDSPKKGEMETRKFNRQNYEHQAPVNQYGISQELSYKYRVNQPEGQNYYHNIFANRENNTQSPKENQHLATGQRNQNNIEVRNFMSNPLPTDHSPNRPYSEPKTIRGSLVNNEPLERQFAGRNRDTHKTQNRKRLTNFKISNDQQNLVTDWAEQIYLKLDHKIQAHEHSDCVLCGVFLKDGQQFATGGKDSYINVYNVISGKLVVKLAVHKASICCMGLINNGQFLASGGDHGCSSVILWDVKTLTVKHRLEGHTAAVTAIVDLQDGQTLASAGYDKKINVFSYRGENHGVSNPKLLFTVVNKANLSSLILNGDRTKLIASGLDKTVLVWRIQRKEDHSFKSISNIKIILVNQFVCVMKGLQLAKDLILAGTRNGKVLMISITTGQTLRQIPVSNSSIMEMVVFERQNKPEYPLILSCASKENKLKLVKIDLSHVHVETVNLSASLNVKFGCGIGPKIVFNTDGILAIVSQSEFLKEVALYNVDIK